MMTPSADCHPRALRIVLITASILVASGFLSAAGVGAADPIGSSPPPLPSGWRESKLLDHEVTVDTPGLAQNLLTIDGNPRSNNPNFYEITITVAGQPLPLLAANTGGNLQQPVHVALLNVSAQQAKVVLNVFYRYDPARITCVASALSSCANLRANPFDPAWLIAEGAEAALIFEVRLEINGVPAASQFVALPIAGLVGATQECLRCWNFEDGSTQGFELSGDAHLVSPNPNCNGGNGGQGFAIGISTCRTAWSVSGIVTSPLMNLAAYEEAKLGFSYWYGISCVPGWGGTLQASRDGGATWTTVPLPSGSCGWPVNGGQGWFKDQYVDLTPFKSTQTQFRFLITLGEGCSCTYFMMDDLRVVGSF